MCFRCVRAVPSLGCGAVARDFRSGQRTGDGKDCDDDRDQNEPARDRRMGGGTEIGEDGESHVGSSHSTFDEDRHLEAGESLGRGLATRPIGRAWARSKSKRREAGKHFVKFFTKSLFSSQSGPRSRVALR